MSASAKGGAAADASDDAPRVYGVPKDVGASTDARIIAEAIYALANEVCALRHAVTEIGCDVDDGANALRGIEKTLDTDLLNAGGGT